VGVSDDPGLVPTLIMQAQAAVARGLGALPGDGLYAVWGGGNDLRALGAEFGAGLFSPDELVRAQSAAALQSGILASINNITTTLGTLASAGARDFLILNLPDLGLTPSARFFETVAPGTREVLTGLSGLFNQRLGDLVAGANTTPGFTLTLLDVFGLSRAAVDNPAAGVNAFEACTSQNSFAGCSDPENFVYWDGVHPTTATHAVIAGAAFEALQPVPVPASLPLAVGGMALLLGVARRRRAA
jgi:phospholipase/lecithinase/hemolysin